MFKFVITLHFSIIRLNKIYYKFFFFNLYFGIFPPTLLLILSITSIGIFSKLNYLKCEYKVKYENTQLKLKPVSFGRANILIYYYNYKYILIFIILIYI